VYSLDVVRLVSMVGVHKAQAAKQTRDNDPLYLLSIWNRNKPDSARGDAQLSS
jgi:hypothetical protein